jgi:hypothetical protein
MDRKEGGGFWCATGRGKLEKLTSKKFFFNLKKTNKQTKASNLLLA